MKVLSLFDGISCGMIALERAGISVERYCAYEIEEKALKISKKNYPNIEQRGDVFDADFREYSDFDLLIGGSPCTYWSIAQKDREVTCSGLGFDLFKQFVRAKRESGCKYFLYENNFSISQQIKDEISKQLGVNPIVVNSCLVSAQHRKRCYWTNIPFDMPKDKGILLSDIIESGKVDRKKSLCIARRTIGNQGSQSYMRRRYFGKSFAQMVFEDCEPEEQKKLWKEDPFKEFDTKGRIRHLSVLEMERLQTLPDGYTECDGVSEIQRAEAIGNGWTVDVIAHIFNGLKEFDKELEKKILKTENSLLNMLSETLDDYSSNDEIAWLDDAWRCLLKEDDGQTFYRNEERQFTDEDLVGEIEMLTDRVVRTALTDHFRRIRKLYLNKK